MGLDRLYLVRKGLKQMKKLLTAGALCALPLVACVSAPYMVETGDDGPFQRTTTRVVERHDAYVEADESLTSDALGQALGQSAELYALAALPSGTVAASVLADALDPVADRHDAYVTALEQGDPLVRDVYLEDTARLRSLLAEAASHELVTVGQED